MSLHDSIALHLACCMTHQEAHAALKLLQRLVLCWASYSRCLPCSAANTITWVAQRLPCQSLFHRRRPVSNTINSLGCAIAQRTGLTEIAAAAAACVPGPAGAAWLGRHAFAGPPGVTSGASSSPAALGSGALGSLMTGTAWHAAAADPTCVCTHKPYNFKR